jgi:hypothetical protein
MKKIINLLSIILLTIATNSCVKNTPPPPTVDANGLPFATQTGANTFGCLVDGVPCSITGAYNEFYGNGVEYALGFDSFLTINVITKDPRKDFYLKAKIGKNTIGTHPANIYFGSGSSSLNIAGGTAITPAGYYYTIDGLPATVTITKFSGNRANGTQIGDIICGSFDMQMQNGNGKIIHLTNGVFDIKRQ